MDIARNKLIPDAEDRVRFCLDRLEQAERFSGTLSLTSAVCADLTVEEIVGALIAAEQQLMLSDQLQSEQNA